MNGNLIALLAGTVLGVGGLAFVLYPLFFAVADPVRERAADPRAADDSAIVALREIEFDRATGKLSEADYTELRATYASQALRELRGADAPGPQGSEAVDPIEARVIAYRATHRECRTCGLRPESDAIYCSTCGSYLERACPDCGAEIVELGAIYCSTCGASLTRARSGAFA